MNPVALTYMPLFGLAVGSVLNLVIDRIPRGESIVTRTSRCDHCQRHLPPWDLVPILSYLWLRGKCRFCGAHIPLRNVVVEAVTGALFVVVAYRFGLGSVAWVILAYSSLLIAITVIDLDHTIIPDKLVFPAMALAFVAAPFGPVAEDRALGDTFLRVTTGGLAALGVMMLIYLFSLAAYRSPAGFGFGDVKLGALIGLVTGFPEVVITMYFAFVSGGVVALLLLLLRLKGRRDAIAYGPFLALGTVATFLVGEDLGWYMGLIQ